MVKKNYDNMLSRFIQYRNVTDGQTDGQIYYYQVSRVRSVCKCPRNDL